MRAIAVLSGGLDSTVSTLIAKDLGYEVIAITFNYGQRAAKREINSAKKICEILGIEHIVVDLPFVKQFKKSSLITEKEIPTLKMEELDSEKAFETMKAVWVPARNVIMFGIASGFAEAFDADNILGCQWAVLAYHKNSYLSLHKKHLLVLIELCFSRKFSGFRLYKHYLAT
jgi:7-cyano-7-deazaguanine synthase